MTSIAKQNTIEALTIYHKAQKKEWGVRVVDGNVRIASWTDKFSSVFKNFFNPNRKRTDWNEKAKEAITNKFCKELTLPQDSPKKIDIENKVADLLKKITENKISEDTILKSAQEILLQDKNLDSKIEIKKDKVLYSPKENYIERKNFFEKDIPEDELQEISLTEESQNEATEISLNEKIKDKAKEIPFEDAFNEQVNINKINNNAENLWKIEDKNKYGLIIEELNHAKDQDFTKASKVTDFTLALIEKFGFSKDTALNAARNICFAMDEFNIESEKAFELVQVRGNLINKRYLKEDLPLKLQLSASLAFMQLRDKGTHLNEAIEIVKNRIDLLKKIQSRIPIDMQIDCVHEKEYEYKISFFKEEKEKIAEKLKTQLNSPLCKINKSLEQSTKKDLITKLAEQCIADAIRSKSIFKKDGINIKTPILETTFDQTKAVEKYSSNGFLNDEFETFKNDEKIPDSNIEDTPESLLEKSFLIPLENFQLQSNLNTKNITDISHFLSQTTLGTLTGLEFDKSNTYIQGVSSNKRGETIYEVDFIDNETKEGNRCIVLSASQYNDGDNLSIIKSVDTGSLTTMLPINEFFNYKQDEKAGPNKFRQKMNVDFEILINQNNEIKIRVIDAGFIYKFSINYEKLDTIEKDEVFLQ